MSLERRLPLMISALLAVTITAFGLLAFSELRQLSIAAASAQVRTLLSQAADNMARTLALRAGVLEAVATAPAVVQAVTASASDSDRAAAGRLVASRRVGLDTALLMAQLLVDGGGGAHVLHGEPLRAADSVMLARTVRDASKRGRTSTGPMYAVDSAVRFWVVSPVRAGGRVGGFLAEQRRIRASAAVEQQIKDLTGQDLSIFYGAPGSDSWSGLRGVPIAPKFDIAAVPDSFQVIANDGEALVGAKAAVRGAPITLVMVIRKASVNVRANALLRRMLAIGSPLMLAGILGAWLVSRRVTRPLKSLTVAARNVANGDYQVREPVRTNDELGQLARAFNGMAERIGESHAQLGIRIKESEALAAQLHRASVAKSEFLAMMSHELRTPLSAIAGYAEILQLGLRGPLSAAQQADLGRIQANQVHLLRIINDILDLAQVESGQLQVAVQPVPLADVLSDLEPIMLPLLADCNIKFDVNDDVLSLVVNAERDRLTQVLVNLVANAIRFTAPGGSISIHGEQEGDRVRLHVTDTGIGIAPEQQEVIFQPFVQVEGGTSRRAQGTGLGLAISRRIVEAVGGTLTVVSVPGAGSTFTLELPSAPRSADASAGAAVVPVGPKSARADVLWTLLNS